MSSDTSANLTPEAAAAAAENREEGEDPILGKVIDGCKVVRKLGQGGMGVVYLAQHEALGQEFVLKILNPALTGAEDTVDRFFREAQACAQLNHPGIVAIQNVGQEGEYYYIRMEYVEGETLEDLVKEDNQVEWKKATEMVIAVADALSHAHQKGMIHRDIKPENIMITPKGEVKVMDFGLAKHVHSSAKVSVTGQIVGTPFFMSPEQAGGKPTDARSDIYSLGVTLYYLVTGVKPFNGKNLQEIFLKHFFYAPESPKIYNEELPDSLCEVVKRCLKKKKKERYQSAKALGQDLRGVMENPSASLEDLSNAAPAPGSEDDDGDKTIATGSADDDGGATVQVNSDDDDGGATVRVGQDGDGNDATVAVKSNKKRTRGEVKSVSFTSASMVFDADDDSTLQIDQDDEEDAHEGLDLPTSVVQMMKDDGTVLIVPDAEEAAADTPESRKQRKKKLIIVGVAVLIPSLFLIGMQVSARSKFGELSTAYNDLRTETQSAASVDLAIAQRWDAMGSDFQEFADGYVLAPNLTPKAADLANKSKLEAERIRVAIKTREREKDKMRAAEEEEQKRQEELQAVLEACKEISTELAARRDVKDGSPKHWKEYTARAMAFLKEYSEKRVRFPEIQEFLEGVMLPVTVTSDPGGAEVFIGQNRDPEEQLTPPRGNGLIWVPPHEEFQVRVYKKGFQEWRSKTHTADKYNMLDAPLSRKLIRPAFSLGENEVKFGAQTVMQNVLPAHDPHVFASSSGFIYFVGRSGLLRSYKLERPGGLEWPTCPGGSSCRSELRGKEIEDVHRIGFYGDPSPGVDVVEEVILVSSLLGNVSAHERSKGTLIWRTNVGSPVTTAPRYLPGNIVAAGTSSGAVVFIAQDGRVHWSYDTDNAITSAPYLAGNLCMVGSTDNRFYVLDWKAKRALGRTDLGSDIVVGPIPVGRRVLVGTTQGQVHLIDVRQPNRPRKAATYGPGKGVVSGIVVHEAGDDRMIYFTVGRSLYAVKENGEPLWKGSDGKIKPFFSPGGSLTAPVLHPDGDLIYVGGGKSGVLYAVDRVKGRERWRFSTPQNVDGRRSPITLKPFVFGDELFVVSGEQVFVLAPD